MALRRVPIWLIFWIRDPVAQLHLLRGDPERELLRKEVVRNPHLVAVGIGAERQQRRMLGLPTEASDAAMAGGDICDDRGPAADTVAVPISAVIERQQHLVGNRFDEPRAKQRDRHAPRDHIRLGRNDRLARMSGNREDLEQGT